MGERIEFDGTGGYLASGEGAGLGVILIPEGAVSPHVEAVCNRLATEGFTALAPDLLTEVPVAAHDLSRAVDYLVAHPSVRGHGVGVIGFGIGGGRALWLATLRPDQVRVAVPFYGAFSSPDAVPDWDRLEAAVEVHYGEADAWVSPDVAKALEDELLARHKEIRVFTYPGVGHGFFDDTRPEAYDDEAARQAWVRTLEFLRAKLG